jgi:hypothetical protein
MMPDEKRPYDVKIQSPGLHYLSPQSDQVKMVAEDQPKCHDMAPCTEKIAILSRLIDHIKTL